MSPFPEEPLSSTAEEGYGYFPVSGTQTLKSGLYKVIRKLGWGPQSSVWLASYPGDTTENDYCVIKILTVAATKTCKANGCQRVKTLESVKHSASVNHVPLYWDNFFETSPHGEHLCIVTLDILPDIETTFRLAAPDKFLRVHIVKKIIASVAESLESIHRMNMIHGGVKTDNFAFAISTIPRFLEPRLADLPPMAVQAPITVDGVEYPVIISQPILHSNDWDDDASSAANYTVYLNNFGHIQPANKKARWDTSLPSSLRPPEVILRNSYTPKADIWLLGLATFLLLTGTPLLSDNQDDATQLAEILKLTGHESVPDAWKSSSLGGELNVQIDGVTIEEKLRSLARLADADVTPAAEFIAACLKIDPSERPSSSDLTNQSWLRDGYRCSCGFCLK